MKPFFYKSKNPKTVSLELTVLTDTYTYQQLIFIQRINYE